MSEKTPTVAGKQLSSSLKERLKRCGRYHSSPRAGTPQRNQLSIEQPPNQQSSDSPQSTDSHQSTVITMKNSENKAKKLCLHNLTETKQSLKDDDHHSKIGSVLSEKQQNQSVSTQRSTDHSEIAQIHSGETGCDKTRRNNSSNQLESESYNSEILSENSNALVNTGSPVLYKTSLETKTYTPVSSRVVKRTSVFRGSRINFDEKTTDTVPKDHSSTQKSVESNPFELSLRGTVTDSDACATTGTSRETGMESSGMMGGTVRDRDSLLKEVKEKEETLRKLKMVKMYQTKNNLIELEVLIEKWRSVAQEGLQDLHRALPEPKPSLTGLLQHLGIDTDLVKFDSCEESFNK